MAIFGVQSTSKFNYLQLNSAIITLTQQPTESTTMPRDRAEVSVVEQADNFANAGGVTSEDGDGIFFSAVAAGLIKDYREGNGGIAFRYSRPDIGGRTKEHGFVVIALPDGRSAGGFAPRGNHEAANDRNDGHQSLVFPHAVEVIEGVQKFIPSTIRPECFDREAVGFAEPLFAFCAIDPAGLIVKAVDGTEYGKMGFAIGYHAFASGERRRQQIKRTANGIDDDADFDIEAEVGSARPADYNQILSRIRIRLYDDGVWAGPLPGYESLLKDWDLGFGPIH